MLDLPPAKIPFDHATRAGEPHDYPIPPLEQKGRVECMQCHEWLAFDRFSDLQDPLCDDCRKAAPERELAAIRQRMCKDFSRRMATVGYGPIALEHIETFLAELMYDFGGMKVFVHEWARQLKESFHKNPGSKANMDQCRSIAKLVLDCNKLQHQENVLELSDEELRVKKELALMQMLSSSATDPHRRQMLAELIRSNGIQLSEIPGLPQYAEVQKSAT